MHACPECGLVLDRDVNAARNLEQEGVCLVSAGNNLGAERYRSHARGDLPATREFGQGGSPKREAPCEAAGSRGAGGSSLNYINGICFFIN